MDPKKKNAFAHPDLPVDYSNVAKLDSMKELGKLKVLKPARKSLPPGVSPAPRLPKKAIPKVNRQPGTPGAKNPKVVRTLIPERNANPLSVSPLGPAEPKDPLGDSVTKLTASPDKHKLNIFKKITKAADDRGKRAGDSVLSPLQDNAYEIDRKPIDTTVSDCIENVIRRGMEEVEKAGALLKEVKKERDVSTSSDSFVDVTGTSPLPASPPPQAFKSPDPVVQLQQRKIKREEKRLEKAKKKKNVDEAGNALDELEPLKNSHYPMVKLPKPKKKKKERPEDSTWEIQPPREHFVERDDYPDYQRLPFGDLDGVGAHPVVSRSPPNTAAAVTSSWYAVPYQTPCSPSVQILSPEVRSPPHTIDITSPERTAAEAPSSASTPVTAASPATLAPAVGAGAGTSPLPGVSVTPVPSTPTASSATSPTKKKLGLGKLKTGDKVRRLCVHFACQRVIWCIVLSHPSLARF